MKNTAGQPMRFTVAMLVLLTASALIHTAPAASQESSLEQDFRNPPNSARPRVWWHWMNGNVSKEGIRKDIEWMSSVGIGGLQNFDAALETPQIVEKRLVYMTPEWKQAFRYAAEQAEQHDLELAIAGSPGWSETGGPWVQPKNGMKKLVWSEVVLQGGSRFNGKLPPVPQVSGPFQDLKVEESAMGMTGADLELPVYSADVAVLAYRMTDTQTAVPPPRISTAAGTALNVQLLNDSQYAVAVEVARGTEENPATIMIDYQEPQTLRTLTLHLPGAASLLTGVTMAPVLEASDDGETWRKIVDVPLNEVPTTLSFAPVKANRYRLVLNTQVGENPISAMGAISSGVDMMSMFTAFGPAAGESLAASASKPIEITELALQSEPRVNAFEQKAGFAVASDYYALDQSVGPEISGISTDAIVNLTDQLSAGGQLDWTPPEGRWKVIRLGYSLTGKTNHPATPEATGLEVDKYDGNAVRDYMQTYLKMYKDATGEALIGKHGLRALLTDSIEVGSANWTPDMIAQFKRLRGYDPTPWLPTLTGVLVGSRSQSDAFLYDFRHTLADLISSQHYGQVAKVAQDYGLTYYSEALESLRFTLGDDMAMRAHADIPMAAIWHNGKAAPTPVSAVDIKGAASVAHIHGQNIVAAESLTSVLQPWASAPADLRPTIDLAFASGVNRPVIHTSVHQPADDKQPGLGLLIFGQYFNRHETWAEMAKPWVDYMARNSFLLQQGRNHADVAYFYGEEGPLIELYKEGFPKDAPRRYAYDFINADAVQTALTVEGAKLVTPGGARYRLLYLGGSSQRMTLPMLRRLDALVKAGATIVGRPPESSPSLKDDPAEFAALVKRLWGEERGPAAGKRRVINSTDVEAVLASLKITPDFTFETNSKNSDNSAVDGEVFFQHRRLKDGDIYLLINRSTTLRKGEARFRVTGKTPEIWRADSGEFLPLSYRIKDGETLVDLEMAPQDSFFVVFRKRASKSSATITAPRWKTLADIGTGPWDVGFQAGRGAPDSLTLPQLTPLNEHTEPGVKYFSGVASYRKSFQLPGGLTPGQPLMLDLGDFSDVAEISVNGATAGIVWREPHRLDISKLVKRGDNELEIRVANLWINRLIGDAQPEAKKITWTSTPVYLPDAPLRPSGLMGPVQLLDEQE